MTFEGVVVAADGSGNPKFQIPGLIRTTGLADRHRRLAGCLRAQDRKTELLISDGLTQTAGEP
jgi:hypothetical protein